MVLSKWGNKQAVQTLKKLALEGDKAAEQHPVYGSGLIYRRLDACGALADIGISDGYEFTKSVFLGRVHRRDRVGAARILPKFARFRKEGIDVVPVLLRGLDKAVEEIIHLPDDKKGGEARLYFGWVHAGLMEVGDERAIARFEELSRSADRYIRIGCEAAIRKIRERLEKAKQTQPAQTQPGTK